MKNLVLALFVFSCLQVQAQKEIQKEVAFQNESVKMDFDLASAIEVRTWEKSSILVRVSIESDDAEITERFELKVNRNGSTIEIGSNSTDLLKVDEDDRVIVNRELDHEFNYIVYLPKGVNLELSSITGNLTSEYLQGNINIDLVTGNIDIKSFEGNLELKTITGKINLPVKNASFKAETVMGEIYANADPNLVKKNKFVGQEKALNVTQAKNILSVNTVTGNIYLR